MSHPKPDRRVSRTADDSIKTPKVLCTSFSRHCPQEHDFPRCSRRDFAAKEGSGGIADLLSPKRVINYRFGKHLSTFSFLRRIIAFTIHGKCHHVSNLFMKHSTSGWPGKSPCIRWLKVPEMGKSLKPLSTGLSSPLLINEHMEVLKQVKAILRIPSPWSF